MKYEGAVYRPPSEADSLIIQATVGCSHNKCLFCTMYKGKQFRIRPLDEILDDLEAAAAVIKQGVKRVFLADGDALVMDMDDLLTIADKARRLFPQCERLALYGSPQSILDKTPDDLYRLQRAGYKLLYLGVESGSEKVLLKMKKGVSSAEIMDAGTRVRQAGITLSAMLILGLGGREHSCEHALESAAVVNAIAPDFLSLLTLIVEEGSPLKRMIDRGNFVQTYPFEALEELKTLVSNLEISTVLRSNHASNYVSINGSLPQDKRRIISDIDCCLADKGRRFSEYRRL